MKKLFSWIVTILLVTSMIFTFVGCKDPEPPVDLTPPGEVTYFSYYIENGIVYLSWGNPSDTDFAGVQISMDPAEGIFANPISLGTNVTYFSVPGLKVDSLYLLRIKTFDTNQNFSVGEVQVITIPNSNPPSDNPGDSDNDNPPSDNPGDSGNDNPPSDNPGDSDNDNPPSDNPGNSGNDNPPNDNQEEDLSDTIAPAQVTNLTAVYDAETLQIIVSWINPEDEDFVGTEISYGPIDSLDPINLSYDKSYSQVIIPGISADDREYYISVKSKDSSGNLSESTYITVIAVNDEIVVPDGLRTGDFVLTDNTYVRKEYYSELTQEERAKIFGIVLITDSGEPLILGTQFSTNESKWTTSSVGIDTYLSDIATGVSGDEDVGYTFTGDLDGSDNWEYICTIDPVNTEGAQVASTYPAFYLANIYASYAGLNGTDFADGWYVPTISELYQMYKNYSTIKSSLKELGISLPYTYDSNLGKYTCRGFWSSSVPSAFGNTAYELDYYYGEIDNVDRGTNSNYVWAFHKFNNNFNCYTYPVAEITSVEIPNVGVTYTGEIPVKITGKNLLAYEITSDDATFSNVKVVSNTEATAVISSPEYVGTHNITINCGTASGSGVLNVVEVNCSVGDILFTDGTRIKAENVQYGIPSAQIPKAFAVVVGLKNYESVPIAVGLQKGSSLEWTGGYTTGYYSNFTEIQAEYSGSSSSGYTFTGDLDGSDNWEYICSVDTEGSQDAETNYPAFNFANTYESIAGLNGTNYASGWYLPSIAELYEVYKNIDVVQSSLDAVGGLTLGISYYWSSSQREYSNSDSIIVSFYYGNVYGREKYWEYEKEDVLVVRDFTPEQFRDYEYLPRITSVEMPTVGSGYTGDVLVTIKGENFIGPDFSINQLSYSKSLSNVTLINDTEIHAIMYCSGSSASLTVSYGSSSKTGSLKIISSSNCFTDEDIGKIVLIDGSFVSKENFNSSTMTAIAVISGYKYNGGQAIGVGLEKSSTLPWALPETTGYVTHFAEIACNSDDIDVGGNVASRIIFTGDVDGSDNWAYICSVDPEGVKNPSLNYPIFNFALTYPDMVGLNGTSYADDWYIPSIKELCDLYKNKDIIQSTLDKIGGFSFEEETYWSSSQYEEYEKYDGDEFALMLQFYNGGVYTDYKSDDDIYGVVVRAFNAN